MTCFILKQVKNYLFIRADLICSDGRVVDRLALQLVDLTMVVDLTKMVEWLTDWLCSWLTQP